MKFCSNCGNQFNNKVNFCDKCGHEIVATMSDIDRHIEFFKIDEGKHTETFVGNNHKYFIDKWSKLTLGKVISWNWAGFFFGFAWLAYRKMNIAWGVFIGYILVLTFIELIFPEIIEKNYYFIITNLLPGIIIGQQGNYWYKLYTEKTVKELSSKYSNDNLNQELSNQGGTSIGNAIALVFVAILVSIVIEIILFGI